MKEITTKGRLKKIALYGLTFAHTLMISACLPAIIGFICAADENSAKSKKITENVALEYVLTDEYKQKAAIDIENIENAYETGVISQNTFKQKREAVGTVDYVLECATEAGFRADEISKIKECNRKANDYAGCAVISGVLTGANCVFWLMGFDNRARFALNQDLWYMCKEKNFDDKKSLNKLKEKRQEMVKE